MEKAKWETGGLQKETERKKTGQNWEISLSWPELKAKRNMPNEYCIKFYGKFLYGQMQIILTFYTKEEEKTMEYRIFCLLDCLDKENKFYPGNYILLN